ncbi:uncharacterized protein LOC133829672 [Humulus lupulus]|uniref:uncharacterized protein LOC133829672 n=1 Tax=Humulus lupulus TaxID=3486 RepID=UPI002B416F78|nr:uncharacterized protein LOC133829672 [Humulus lupulus]
MREIMYMELPIPRKVKKIWDAWDLRVCIMGSLLLQIVLIFFAPLRQRFKTTPLRVLLWSAYLLADWVAAVAIGIITKSQGDVGHLEGNDDLFALWASFLLLHLGGPDNITSFSLEDNELWIRHLFGLILQVLSASYSLYLTLPTNKLWLPSLLVFVGGVIKFAERTQALYLASLDHFGTTVLPEPNPGPDYEEATATYSSIVRQSPDHQTTTNSTTTTTTTTSSSGGAMLSEMKLLEIAYARFESFKGLIVGFLVSLKDRESSRIYFLNDNALTAFRLIEYELSFMYQVLHTKVVVLHCTTGYILRAVGFLSIVSAAIIFFTRKKHINLEFGIFEIKITYALFIGAIVLDVISVFKIVFSDWILMHRRHRRWLGKLVPSVVSERSRWCGSISQYSMINYCLDRRRSWKLVDNFAEWFRVTEILDSMKTMIFSKSETVPDYLKEFIFDELRIKSSEAKTLSDAVKASQQRGDSALSRNSSSYAKLKWSVSEFQYGESLLVWHLATELCQNDPEDRSSYGGDGKRISKLISDYMFYLLVMKTTMLAPVLGNWHVVFQDTCAETKRYLNKHKLSKHFQVYEKTALIKTKFRASAVKGITSKSVFFDACILAQQLRLEVNGRWNVMSQVWVELLSYAAINCRSIIHAQQLSKGGELLTFTWLMMYHFGLGTQFTEQERQDTTNTNMGIMK